MRRRKKNNKIQNLVFSLIILAFLCFTGYYGTDFLHADTDNNNVIAFTSGSIENSELINLENNDLNIMFFYVGQADSTFVKLENKTMLIDAGNNKDGSLIAEFLKEKGINKLDYLVGTHADEDHIGGLDDIINALEIGEIYLPTVGSESTNYVNVTKAAEEKNIEINHPVRGDTFNISNAKCEIMSAMEEDNVTDNNSSIVIQMTYNNTKYLFMGDAEKEVENSRSWNQVDILKVGHHGSNSSSSEKFLAQVKPKYSIIEVGVNNSYNLPSSKAIQRLEETGTQVLRTDKAIGEEAGSFWLTSDGTNIEIKAVNINLDGNK